MSDDTITDGALAKSFAQENDDPWLLFLTITHSSIEGGPLCLVLNTVDVDRTVTAGHPAEGTGTGPGNNVVTFRRSGFEYVPPVQSEENSSVGRLRVPNADRGIVKGLRKLQGTEPATVLIELALASDPDTPQQTPIELDLDAISYDADYVEGRLSAGALNSAWPGLVFDNASFPGIFPG